MRLKKCLIPKRWVIEGFVPASIDDCHQEYGYVSITKMLYVVVPAALVRSRCKAASEIKELSPLFLLHYQQRRRCCH